MFDAKNITGFFLASLSKMSSKLRLSNDIIRSIKNDTTATRNQNDLLVKMFKEQKEDNQRMNAFLHSKIPDMNDYFPLKDTAAMDRFLDEWDGLYPLKRSEFYNMLINCVSEKPNLFGTAILNTFFSEEFIKTHSWPSAR